MKHRISLRILCLVLTMLMVFSLCACGASNEPETKPGGTKFDWNVTATILSKEGKVGEQIPFRMYGTFFDDEKSDSMNAAFEFPDSFPHVFGKNEIPFSERYPSPTKTYFDTAVGTKNGSISIAIDWEQNCMIIIFPFDEGDNYYLVASPDANKSANDIFERFASFVNTYTHW